MAVSATLATSCSKELELKDPQGLPPADALASSANISKVLEGGYDALSSSNLYGGNIPLFADLLGSNTELNWVGTFNTYREIWGKNILTSNPIVYNMWASGYRAINIANNVLANIDKVNEAQKSRIRGEALFIRGLVHFDLVRMFAKDFSDGNASSNPGIPIMTKATNSTAEIDKPTRNSVAEVYAAVIKDLTDAEGLLPVNNGVFATKAAAAAILSRVYLQQANYPGARDAANRGIQHATVTATGANRKSLNVDYMSNFNAAANTPETIFGIQINDQDGANNLQLFYSVDIFGARDGDIEVNDTHLALYGPGDVRGTVTSNPGAATFNTAFYTKYGAFRTTKHRDLFKNITIIRLAELYLTRAEANFRAGTTVGATPLEDINRIRQRAGASELTALTLDEILRERRRELAFEGFAIHDLKRNQRTIDGLPANSNRLVLPIPFRERNANNNLVQNPGYN